MAEFAISPTQIAELNRRIVYRIMLGGIHMYMSPLLVSYKASNEKIREILVKATLVEKDPLARLIHPPLSPRRSTPKKGLHACDQT